MAITYISQLDNSVQLYSDEYYGGENNVKYTDGTELNTVEISSPEFLLEDLQSAVYKINVGSSEKYIELHSDSLNNILDFLFNNLKPTEITKKNIIEIIDEYGLSLIEALYFLLKNNYSKDILKLLISSIDIFNSNNYYSNLDLNTIVRIKSNYNNKIMNIIINGKYGDKIHISRFVPKGYQYIEEKNLDDSGEFNLSFLKKGYLYRIKLEVDDVITNYFYIYAMTIKEIKDIWSEIKKTVDLIESRFNEEKYLPLVYQDFDSEDKKAILMARLSSPDSFIYDAPILEQNEDYFVAYFEKTKFNLKNNNIYLCITDIEGLAANQILIKEKVTNLILEVPLAGKTIYDGHYFFYLCDEKDRILSKISIFNKDSDIELKYNEATIKEFIYELVSYLKSIYEEKDVDLYSPVFFNEISNPLSNSSNFFNLIIEKLVLTYRAEDFFDLIFDLYRFKYKNQGYKKNYHYLIHDNKAKRIITPPLKNGNVVIKAMKFSREGYSVEYKEISDSAEYTVYSDADYTIVAIYEKDSSACLGFVVVKKYGHDYYFQNWNVNFE